MGSLAAEGLERLSLPLEDPSKVQAQTGYLWSPSAPWWLVPSVYTGLLVPPTRAP